MKFKNWAIEWLIEAGQGTMTSGRWHKIQEEIKLGSRSDIISDELPLIILYCQLMCEPGPSIDSVHREQSQQIEGVLGYSTVIL